MVRKSTLDFKRWEITYLNNQGVLNNRKKTTMINVSEKAVRKTLKQFGRELQNTIDTSRHIIPKKVANSQNSYIDEHFKVRERNSGSSQNTEENMGHTTLERQSSVQANEKSAKYDRQLRLWGNHGQTNLENSRVCLINATSVGTEALKSIVLPGVGYFNIVDDNRITEEDVSSNFFLTIDSIGQNRAKIASQLLCEMNPDVIGDYLEENVDLILANRPEYFNSFDIVLASNLKENTMKKLSQHLWNENVPLILLRSYGLIGYIRIVSKEHTIVEAHPDNELPDLRLDKPFDELVTFSNLINLDELTDAEHSHIPYLIILYKYLQIWKSQNNGQIPKNYKEKLKFKELVKTGIRKTDEDDLKFEENFEEAMKNVNSCISETKIPSEIQSLFEDEKSLNLNFNSKPFWVIIRAIQEFTENEGQGQLPLRGSIPDMVSDTERFVSLQNVYKAKAQHDIESVLSRVERLCLNINKPYDFILEQQVKLFCKNSYFLKSIKFRSLEQECDPQTSKIDSFMDQISEADEDFIFYLLIRSVEIFYRDYSRYPGENSDNIDSDVGLLKHVLNKFLNENKVQNFSIKDDFLIEMCRYGNCELHSVSAYLGGCAAQECIKLLTKQFVPFNNTLIYNGIKQTTSIYEL